MATERLGESEPVSARKSISRMSSMLDAEWPITRALLEVRFAQVQRRHRPAADAGEHVHTPSGASQEIARHPR